MNIGDEVSVSYFGLQESSHVFTDVDTRENILVPDNKLFGTSVLNIGKRFTLRRNTFSQYTVSVAS